MDRYRQKAPEIEAELLSKDNVEKLVALTKGLEVEETDPTNEEIKYVGINVPSSTGTFRISEGEYLIKDAQGEFFKLSPESLESNFIKL